MADQEVNIETLRIDYIQLRPKAGTPRDKVIKEAVMVALFEGAEVRFAFNDEEYKISPEEVISYLRS